MKDENTIRASIVLVYSVRIVCIENEYVECIYSQSEYTK